MSTPLVPKSIQKKSDTEMSIAWSTGETTSVRFTTLRFQCRCAECVDEWTRVRRIKEENIPADIKPTVIEQVGRYAIQIDWTDGHRTGIYPYDLLYELSKNQNS